MAKKQNKQSSFTWAMSDVSDPSASLSGELWMHRSVFSLGFLSLERSFNSSWISFSWFLYSRSTAWISSLNDQTWAVFFGMIPFILNITPPKLSWTGCMYFSQFCFQLLILRSDLKGHLSFVFFFFVSLYQFMRWFKAGLNSRWMAECLLLLLL